MGEHVTKSPLEFGVIVCLDRQEILVNMVSVLYQWIYAILFSQSFYVTVRSPSYTY